ncbi:MAG: N-6 DNA methylase [Paludibacteraceae bacterium]|nr:N-6 DNA methylase [Paludibacteraceae bacterium]
MNEFISLYIKEISLLYQTGLTTEHSFRPALQRLLHSCTACTVINEQSHIDCGAPDLTLLCKQLPIAYIEAKDLEDGDLDGRKKNKEQFDRYKASLDTIIFTDYLDFHLYEHGEWQQSVRLAEIQGNKIRLSDADRFISLMEHIRSARPQRITSASKLAQLMAGKARLLRDIIEQALIQDGDSQTELRGYMQAFQQVLIHDITPKTFADIYAQTIAYGMFAARLHDDSPNDFSRAEAANLIPKTNPFLRKIFQQIAGYDLDERIAWIVDDLVSAFAATDMERVMQGFGKSTQQTDPMLHFYEDFLFQYDPAAKKQCGVYYTPQPVVEFIVRAVDHILRTEFNIPMGLADTARLNGHPRVQVLDPATGTGTFLTETVRQIKRDLDGQMGAWKSYVPEHLLPRLHGFELMMAPYTIAHLKLDMEIGIPAQDRLRVFLTNSLEEANIDAGTLFGSYLAQEANAASIIKKEAPIMIVMGNPPYSISSNNKGNWINHLLDDYKKNLNERNIQPLSDDYIKFIRLAQYYVERNGEGVLAYICNNSFIDGLIHRQMRSELLRVFDKIYILDLHGNTRKKETAPDGSKDENVFDIMQGVSINIFIKKSAKSKSPAEVRHFDLYGTRETKYDFLHTHNLASVDWQFLNPQTPSFFFVPKDFSIQKEYEKGFSVAELMKNVSGVQSGRDDIFVDMDKEALGDRVHTLLSGNLTPQFIQKYKVVDSSSYPLLKRMENSIFSPQNIVPYYYRIFDIRYIYYDKDLIKRSFYNLLRHTFHQNISFLLSRQQSSFDFQHIVVSSYVSDMNAVSMQTREGNYVFPLYLYPEPGSIDTSRRPNLDEHIWAKINTTVRKNTTPEDIFDYIYGVLHSPAYRAKYKEFLKVDFPRIPYPKDDAAFDHFRFYGHQLRELHLMRSVPDLHVTFPEPGSMLVEKAEFSYRPDLAAVSASPSLSGAPCVSAAAPSSLAPTLNVGIGSADSPSISPALNAGSGIVRINATQYFANVPREAWDFYIGGYQPARKWLKDRLGRTLSYDDITHYRRIIAILIETARLMREIDS